MDSFDSNIIKPIDGLQSISGMDPTMRREQRKRRQNMDSGKKEDQSKLHDEEININQIDESLEINDNGDDTKIDFCA